MPIRFLQTALLGLGLALSTLSSTSAADFTVIVPDEKARTWTMAPMLLEKCQQDVAYRGDINTCLYLRNFLAEFAVKMKNEIDAQAQEKK